LKAAVLALKAGAVREDRKAELPRRSADAIVVRIENAMKERRVLKRLEEFRASKSFLWRVWLPHTLVRLPTGTFFASMADVKLCPRSGQIRMDMFKQKSYEELFISINP
jgi:hypothetical protein